MTQSLAALRDGEQLALHSNGQDWVVSWQPPGAEPTGTAHGAAGVCVAGHTQLVLISRDGEHWGFPAGRPDEGEEIGETLAREVLEEACAVVTSARLLGYTRSECIRGRQQGVVLVRSYWRAEVEVRPWQPRFEIRHRKLVALAGASTQLSEFDDVATRISYRALDEAGIGDGREPVAAR